MMKKHNDFSDVENYEKWFVENNCLFASEVKALKQLVPAAGEGIEIGVGTGIFAIELGVNQGLEPSEEMRAKAIERGISVIDASAEKIPIADERYDFALMITVDCFLEDVLQAFRETQRILRTNGFFIIAFLDRETALGRIYEKKKNTSPSYKNANFHSAEEIENYLKLAGFVIEERKQTVFELENKPQAVRAGVGEGLFAVIKAKKSV